MAGRPADGGRIEWSTETLLVVAGLTIGWVLGLAGTFVDDGSTAQESLWVVSSVGLLVSTVLLSLRTMESDRLFAAGVLVFALGEAVIHAGGVGATHAFAGATYAYVGALLLVALSDWGPIWSRFAAAGSGLAFAAHAIDFLDGYDAGPNDPFASIGYGLLSVTIIGWTWYIVRGEG